MAAVAGTHTIPRGGDTSWTQISRSTTKFQHGGGARTMPRIGLQFYVPTTRSNRRLRVARMHKTAPEEHAEAAKYSKCQHSGVRRAARRYAQPCLPTPSHSPKARVGQRPGKLHGTDCARSCIWELAGWGPRRLQPQEKPDSTQSTRSLTLHRKTQRSTRGLSKLNAARDTRHPHPWNHRHTRPVSHAPAALRSRTSLRDQSARHKKRRSTQGLPVARKARNPST